MVDRVGTPRNDVLFGSSGDDQLYGLGGGDELYGGLGNDILGGGFRGFPDQTISDGAQDFLYGGQGNDTLLGMDLSADVLRGGKGKDQVYANNDIVFGGRGHDSVLINGSTEGARNDVTLGAGADKIEVTADRSASTLTVVSDFGANDSFRLWLDRGDGSYDEEGEMWRALDSNADGKLDADDEGTRMTGGDFVRVDVSAEGMRLAVNDDALLLRGVEHIDQSQWLL
jgi:hypothetical protein